MPRIQSPEALSEARESFHQEYSGWRSLVTLSSGTCGQAAGALAVQKALEEQLNGAGKNGDVHLRVTGCHGFCQQEPLLILEPLDILYCRVQPEDVAEIVSESLIKGKTIERLLFKDPVSGAAVRTEQDLPFFAQQDRQLMRQNRFLDPWNIEEYIAQGGYAALSKALTRMTPDGVIEEVTASGLRGCGGGGYPTGHKWGQCKAAPGEEHYVICNADEGDPGAYMDRSILEGNPHSVLEGMLIGAYGIGSSKGFVYVRKEYPMAVLHIRHAVEQAREFGLLGQGILGTDFNFDVKVVRGGGAFVCGESTALMASLEGKVGEPRAKDIHTVEAGYLDQPTNLNNVETWANVPRIIQNGSIWFAEKGTRTSKGTKIFALTGQVKNTGLVEVDMGTSLREIIFDIGGGPKDGRRIKAVQTGGPSGGCLPISEFHLPVDFDALYDAGSMMGSGGMVVLDDSACMVDMAKYFLTFLQDESCGKCVPCRVGVGRLLEIVTDISEGRGREDQFDLLDDLAWTISVGSLCALGKTAANPVLSTLKYFKEEYEEHINHQRCPAAVCRALVHYSIDQDNCKPCCSDCAEACPHDAININEDVGLQFLIDDAQCTKCGICMEVCPTGAISKA